LTPQRSARQYAADMSRTVPVDGRFNARQREIYDIVYGAQQAAIDAIKPGVYTGTKDRKGSLWNIAHHYMNAHGKDRHGGARRVDDSRPYPTTSA
jgi:Xaa-Pro aminopeptidase